MSSARDTSVVMFLFGSVVMVIFSDASAKRPPGSACTYRGVPGTRIFP